MRKLIFAMLLIPLVIGACKRAGDDSPNAAKPATATAGQASVKGSAFYLERIQLPPNTVLEVQLFEDRRADTPESIVAQQRFPELKGPPYEFVLAYDPARIRDGATYSLKAALVSPDNARVEFVTDTRVPVDPRSDKPVQFRVVRVPGS